MSSSCSSEKSDSSTIVYNQEPFETYKTRVLNLCQTLALFSDKKVSIERLAGGGFNRIIGISVHSANDSTDSQYILRIPRFEAAQLSRDIAPLQLLSHRSDILAPKVVAFDTTGDNALESPYMIQQRIPGSDLFTTYPTTTHETKCAVARELGKVFFAMHATRSTIAGNLIISPDRGGIMIQSLHSSEIMMPYQDGPPTQTALEMLLAAFEYKKAMSVAKGPNDSFRVELWDAFTAITSEMGSLGVLEADFYCLCHLDLEPRNILVNPLSAQTSAITGILDWDSAIFAPPFMSCAPPMWLWAWNEDEEEDERLANDAPPTAESRELKQLFEDAAGPYYRRFAYAPQYRLSRRLVRFALDGLQSNEDLKAAKSLREEWAEMQAELKAVNPPSVELQAADVTTTKVSG